MKIQMVKVDMKTGRKVEYVADAQSERDDSHKTYSLTYEGYISEWKEVA